MNVPERRWIWFGDAGHFICSDRCLFHLHTHVGGWCVSTVGDFYPDMNRPPSRDRGKRDTVGYNRFFETMVFRVNADGSLGDEVYMRPANSSGDAQAEHITACRLSAIGHFDDDSRESGCGQDEGEVG